MGKHDCKKKYYIRNTFQNFHFGNAIFFVHITSYHSPPTQIFVKYEWRYRAACLNNWVVLMFIGPCIILISEE